MSKKHINFQKLRPQTCCECGRRIHTRDTNVCRACLEKILADTEVNDETITKQ